MKKKNFSPPYPYCPWCKAPLNSDNPYQQECSSCDFILYHTSSPCMGAIPIGSGGRVLLARRGIEPFYGDWNTIGGFLEYNEDPLEGLTREVKEETGVGCIIKDFICINSDIYGSDGKALLNTYYTVQLLSDDVHPLDDVSELKWFSLDELPKNIAFKSDRRALVALKKQIHE